VGPIVFSFESSITIDHTKVPNTDQVNFPVLISGAFNYLATTANGGQVQNASGYDIVFTADIAGTNRLDHEIESYDPVTGTINFWVRIPLLSHSTDTVIFLQYGSNVVITSQENRAGVWDSNYQMVLHLDEAAAPYRDSTSNAYASTGGGASYPAQGQGKIGKGQAYNGNVGQYIAYSQSQSPNPNGAITMEAWVKTGSAQGGIFQKGQTTNSYGMLISNTAQGTLGSTNGSSVGITGTSVINDNVWHHVVVAAPPTGNIVLYTDGVQNTVVNNSSPLLATVTDPLLVGISCANCTALAGTLDEVRISNSVRSADWVAAEYSNQNAPAAFSALGQQNAPVITSLSPSSGEAGSSFTITGSGFTSTQGTVTLNGHAVTVSSWSSSSIVVVVPFGTTSGPVVVTASGVPTNGFGFTVLQPIIASLSPNTGNPGTTVTIAGANFDATQGAGGVSFGGVPASIASWSATSIAAYVPSNAATGNVVVTAPNGVASNGVSFSVTDNFAINLLSPATGPAGTTINIIGGGFGATQGSSIIELNGVFTPVSSWNENQITAVVPVGASTGTVNLTIGSSTAVSPSPFVITTTVQIADSFGRSSSYTSSILGGTWLGSSATGSGCSSCTVRGNVQSAFDASGNLLSFTDELGHVTSYAYDAAGNLATQSAQLTSTTAVTTSYTYNSFGEPLTVTDPLGNTTTNTYDANGNLLTVTTPAPNSSTPASVTQFAYDSKGELTQITDPLNHITTLTYTPAGLISTISDAQSNVTTYQYDAHGNRTAVIDAQQNKTSFAYDAMDRLTTITYPDQTTASFGYDSRGRRISVTDQNGKVTTYTYDDTDRLTQVKDAANNVTQYTYDSENNVLSITDANGHATAFAHDAFGRVTQTTFPSTKLETYLYDATGNLVNKTDRNGHSILYVYDALNRLTHKGYPDSTGVDYVYDLAGKIKQVTDPTGTYGMAYDNMGRLIGTTTQYSFLPGSPAPTFSNSYVYDAASNRTSLTLPDGSTDTYSYDVLNRISTLTDSMTGQFGFGYDTLSRRTSLTKPNGVNTSYGYDSLSRLQSVLHKVGATTMDGASYAYDNAGNRTAKTNQLNNVTEQYVYDAIYELTRVSQGATTTESYTYDPVGNRLSSLNVSSYSYNSSNELTSTPSLSFTYDNNGNTLSKTSSGAITLYTWDFENRLSSAALPGSGGTVTFKYDLFGRRIQKSSLGGITNYLYDGANVIEEINSTGTLVARYTQNQEVDEPLAQLRSGASSYYERDGLGSVSSLSNSSGSLMNTYVYDSFGNLTSSSGTAVNPFQYTGRDYDAETGLRYYRARYYDPQIGKFISEDPLGFAGDSPNFFAYVSNNPAGVTDHFGLRGEVAKAGLCQISTAKFTGKCRQFLEALANMHGISIDGLIGQLQATANEAQNYIYDGPISNTSLEKSHFLDTGSGGAKTVGAFFSKTNGLEALSQYDGAAIFVRTGDWTGRWSSLFSSFATWGGKATPYGLGILTHELLHKQMVGGGFNHDEMRGALDAVGVSGFALGREDISDRIGRICFGK
jgi:RHS repeat-associated protein